MRCVHILLIIILSLGITSGYLGFFLDMWELYFFGEAICWIINFSLWYIVLSWIDEHTKLNVRKGLVVCRIALWLTAANLFDELFGNPVSLGINDLLFVLGSIVTEYLSYKKQLKTKNNGN